MILHNRRGLWALVLGLIVAGGLTSVAEAAPTYSYRTIGNVTVPSGSQGGLVFYDGISSSQIMPPGSIDLGTFKVSTAALSQPATTYSNVPFEIFASVGTPTGDAVSRITGVINGHFGVGAINPGLTATINAVTPYGANVMPFDLKLPIDSPMTLAMPTSGVAGQTSLNGAVPPTAAVPEPASVAVFAVALGGLGLWHRRRRAA